VEKNIVAYFNFVF